MTPQEAAWFEEAVAGISTHFHRVKQVYVPDKTVVSRGWPSVKAFAKKGRRIGECWAPEASQGGFIEVFISPCLVTVEEILSTLAHELVHATVGTAAKHGKVFSQFGRAIGLEGKPTQMAASAEFSHEVLIPLAEQLGPYPHSALDRVLKEGGGPEKKQGTRMLKVVCKECGYTARTTAKWIEDPGPPLCPCNNEPMELEEPKQ